MPCVAKVDSDGYGVDGDVHVPELGAIVIAPIPDSFGNLAGKVFARPSDDELRWIRDVAARGPLVVTIVGERRLTVTRPCWVGFARASRGRRLASGSRS